MTTTYAPPTRPACRSVKDPEIFFSDDDADIADAKEVCRPCPLKTECLTQAIEASQPFGVWGGMTRQERGAELAKRRKFVLQPPQTITERRAAVAQLSEHMTGRDVARLLGVKLSIVVDDRRKAGVESSRRPQADIGAIIEALAGTGLPRRLIAEQAGVSRRTVERRLKGRSRQVAA